MSSLDLNNTFGALLLGTILSSILYGFTCIQTWHYFQNYADGSLVKVTVSALWFLESLHSSLSIHAIYYYVILNYANPTALLKATWSAASVLIVTSLISAIVHVFYIWRVYIVSRRNMPLVILIAVLELVGLGAGLAVPAKVLKLQFFSSFRTVTNIVIPEDITLSLATVVDILIAGSLSIYLHNSRSGLPSTDKIINRLVVHAINNGMLTSFTEILCLALGTAHRSNLVYLAIYQCIGNLYTNSMLATLNARRSMANNSGPSVELSGLSRSARFEPTSTPAGTSPKNEHHAMNEDSCDTESIVVDTNVHVRRDHK